MDDLMPLRLAPLCKESWLLLLLLGLLTGPSCEPVELGGRERTFNAGLAHDTPPHAREGCPRGADALSLPRRSGLQAPWAKNARQPFQAVTREHGAHAQPEPAGDTAQETERLLALPGAGKMAPQSPAGHRARPRGGQRGSLRTAGG